MLATTDILVNLLPFTLETRGPLDHRQLTMLPRGAALINARRDAMWYSPISSRCQMTGISAMPCSLLFPTNSWLATIGSGCART